MMFRIRELRKAKGLTQVQLAVALGLKNSATVSLWESGERVPSSEMLPKLADVLGCTIGQLYADETPEENVSNLLDAISAAQERVRQMAMQ